MFNKDEKQINTTGHTWNNSKFKCQKCRKLQNR